MDLELKKGFQELQAQMIDTRTKIASLEAYYRSYKMESKINDSVMEEFNKEGKHEYLLEPVGRMLVKRSGEEANKFLQDRSKIFETQMKKTKEAIDLCLAKSKESENSLRELVNRKLNKSVAPADQGTSSNASESKPSNSGNVSERSPTES